MHRALRLVPPAVVALVVITAVDLIGREFTYRALLSQAEADLMKSARR